MNFIKLNTNLVLIFLSFFFVDSCNEKEVQESQSTRKTPQPITQIEIEKLLQNALDDRKLKEFFHSSESSLPFQLSVSDVSGELDLLIDNRVIDLVEYCKEGENCIWVYNVEIADSTVKIELKYDIEGVGAEYIYFRIDTAWHLVYSSVIEH